jgi:hypothetical protein
MASAGAALFAGFGSFGPVIGEISAFAAALLGRGRLVPAGLAAMAALPALLAGLGSPLRIVGEVAAAASVRTGALLIACHFISPHRMNDPAVSDGRVIDSMNSSWSLFQYFSFILDDRKNSGIDICILS